MMFLGHSKMKKILLYVLVIFGIGTIVYFYNNSSNDSTDEEKTTLLSPDKHQQNSTKSSTALQDININLDPKAKINPFADSSIGFRLHASVTCMNAGKYILSSLKKKENVSLTIRQEKARDSKLEYCDDWFLYYDSLSDLELETLKIEFNNKIIENGLKLNKFYGDKNEETTIDAKSIVATGGSSDTAEITPALNYLLQNDFDFLHDIGEILGTKDYSNLQSQSTLVSLSYACFIRPDNCSASSPVMLNLCLENDDYCGMSFTQYNAATMTANQYADLIRTLEIIQSMVRDGYFNGD
ncbi:hypothetical protein MNBD_GAMMA01-165 [hydrothermal vent metagenome]|uniref:Uncharacterized protein n=1 Tax=hydrothermal vent metagenome TaxID=652676 RepID=A0A3B0VMJ1_9ZZZZ